jgi:hypothetical protein
MRIVEVWSLKRGPQNPPRPLEPEHSAWVENLWWERDHPEQAHGVEYWGTLRRELPIASGDR